MGQEDEELIAAAMRLSTASVCVNTSLFQNLNTRKPAWGASARHVLGGGLSVLSAVHFDHESEFQTHEIKNVVFERMLPAKLGAELIAAEAMPQLSFSICHFLAQTDGERFAGLLVLAVHVGLPLA